MLVGDACFKAPIILRFHDLHPSDNRRVVGKIFFYQERDQFFLFFGSCGLCVFWPFFNLSGNDSSHRLLLGFLTSSLTTLTHVYRIIN